MNGNPRSWYNFAAMRRDAKTVFAAKRRLFRFFLFHVDAQTAGHELNAAFRKCSL